MDHLIVEDDHGRFGWLHDDAPSFETRRFALAAAIKEARDACP